MIVKLIFLAIFVSIGLVLISPLVLLLAVYKVFANLCLRWRILAPMDIIWDLDRDQPLGTINVMMLLSGEKIQFERFKKLAEERFVPLDPKLKCLRKLSLFGFHYWQKIESFNLDEYVKALRWEEVVKEKEMRQILEKIIMQKLPYDHEATWELYLGPQLKSEDGIHQSIICRLHHSLGDGPALLKTILCAMASLEDQKLLTIPEAKVTEYLRGFFTKKSLLQNFAEIMTSIKEILFPTIGQQTYLHGTSSLNGCKQIAWRCSSELMDAAKSIRKSTGAPFSAGLIASFLEALVKNRQYADASREITFTMPFQTKYSSSSTLTNNFTFALSTMILPSEGQDALSQVRAVEKSLQETKSMAVLATNGLIIRAIGWLCPRPLAKYILATDNVQIDFSNNPGPEAEISYANSHLHKIACWIPHLDKTGVGVSVVSYNGDLNLGLNLDTAICKGPNEAEEIMDLWVKRLCQMAKELAQTKI